jgi:hypothetical protein
VCAGDGRLDHDREPEPPRCRDRTIRVGNNLLGNERYTERLENAARLLGSQPGVVRRAQRLLDHSTSGVSIDAVQRRHRSRRSPQPFGPFRGEPERLCRRLRERERSDWPGTGPERFGDPLTAYHHRQDRLIRLRSVSYPLCDVHRRGDDRRDEDHNHGVDPRIARHEGKRRLVRCRRGRPQHVDRIGEAGLAREHGLELCACLSRQLRKLEPGFLTGIGSEDSEASSVRQHGDAPSSRQRLRGKQHGGIEELLERRSANHAGLVEEGVDRGIRAGERRCVRTGGAVTGLRRSALHPQHGLAPRHPPGQPAELPRVPERLHVEEDDVGLVVALPVLEQVVRGDVRLVPDRDERREAETALVCFLEQRQPERSRLRGKPDTARREGPRGERRVQARFR